MISSWGKDVGAQALGVGSGLRNIGSTRHLMQSSSCP